MYAGKSWVADAAQATKNNDREPRKKGWVQYLILWGCTQTVGSMPRPHRSLVMYILCISVWPCSTVTLIALYANARHYPPRRYLSPLPNCLDAGKRSSDGGRRCPLELQQIEFSICIFYTFIRCIRDMPGISTQHNWDLQVSLKRTSLLSHKSLDRRHWSESRLILSLFAVKTGRWYFTNLFFAKM